MKAVFDVHRRNQMEFEAAKQAIANHAAFGRGEEFPSYGINGPSKSPALFFLVGYKLILKGCFLA
jgi:hypothetical protein